MELRINHFAVAVCTFLSLVVPLIWYDFFEEQWMSMNQLTEEFVRANQTRSMYLSGLISGLVGSYVLAWLWQKMHIQTAREGLVTGLVVGFGLVFLSGMVENLFSFRPYALSWIDGGKSIIWITISGVILGSWTRKS